MDCFLPDDAVLRDLDRVTHLPAVLVHGRLDVSSPVRTAWGLHRRWPGSRLVVVDEEGHVGPRMLTHVVSAIAELVEDLERRDSPPRPPARPVA